MTSAELLTLAKAVEASSANLLHFLREAIDADLPVPMVEAEAITEAVFAAMLSTMHARAETVAHYV